MKKTIKNKLLVLLILLILLVVSLAVIFIYSFFYFGDKNNINPDFSADVPPQEITSEIIEEPADYLSNLKQVNGYYVLQEQEILGKKINLLAKNLEINDVLYGDLMPALEKKGDFYFYIGDLQDLNDDNVVLIRDSRSDFSDEKVIFYDDRGYFIAGNIGNDIFVYINQRFAYDNYAAYFWHLNKDSELIPVEFGTIPWLITGIRGSVSFQDNYLVHYTYIWKSDYETWTYFVWKDNKFKPIYNKDNGLADNKNRHDFYLSEDNIITFEVSDKYGVDFQDVDQLLTINIKNENDGTVAKLLVSAKGKDYILKQYPQAEKAVEYNNYGLAFLMVTDNASKELDQLFRALKFNDKEVFAHDFSNSSIKCSIVNENMVDGELKLKINKLIKERYMNTYNNTLELPTEQSYDMFGLYDNLDRSTSVIISLEKNKLPIDCLLQIIASPDTNKLGLVVADGDVWQGYIYNLDDQSYTKIPDSQKYFGGTGCGCKYMNSFLGNGRYLLIYQTGHCSFMNTFIYDLKTDKFFSPKESGYGGGVFVDEKFNNYIIYAESSDGSCEVNNLLIAEGYNGCSFDTISAYDFNTGTKKIIYTANLAHGVSLDHLSGDIIYYHAYQYTGNEDETTNWDAEINLAEILN